ncbi:MAG TPA: hypothetical protein EYM89_01010, partial [Candidatus Marinimicrobia bacterium]|nr:hypothetical protein [Candidatus Neomarinimicrobiota bacterium]
MSNTEHSQQSFWRQWIFSLDHKVIGLQYGLTSLSFLLLGFMLMMLMRWQLAYPGEAVPWLTFVVIFILLGLVILVLSGKSRPYLALNSLIFFGIA